LIALILALVAAAAAAWMTSTNDIEGSVVGGSDGDPTPTEGQRTIDAPDVPDSATRRWLSEDAAARMDGAAVPVLAPGDLTREQAAGFAERFRATPDGYFARLSLTNLDVVLNGTRRYAVAPEREGATATYTSQVRISESETGLAASFSRFGADYEIEFSCRGPGGEETPDCITEAEARALIDRLVAVGAGR
jgi:hypothetical protein